MADILQVLLVAESDADASWGARFVREIGAEVRVERDRDAIETRERLAADTLDVCLGRLTKAGIDSAFSAFEGTSGMERAPLILLADAADAPMDAAVQLGALVCVPSL